MSYLCVKLQPSQYIFTLNFDHFPSSFNFERGVIKGADRPILEAFSELCLNLIKKNIKLSAQQIDKLRPYEEEIYQLSLRKHGVEKRKKLIQSGGLLSALLSAVLPALISSVVAATSK